MEIYIRKRGSGPSLVAVAAFVFGLLIGFTACYAIFVPFETEPGPTDVAQLPPDEATPPGVTPAEPETVPDVDATPEPEEPAEAEPPPTPETELEMLEDPWAARHLFLAIKGTKLDDATRDLLAELKPGGIVLKADNITNKVQTIGLIKSIKDAVGLGKEIDSLPLIAVAQDGGDDNPLRLSNAPSPARIGERRDIEVARRAGMDLAESCVSRGIGVLFAPCLDVYGPDAPEALRAQTLDTDYQTVRTLGLAFAQGVTQGGVIPVFKHFPGIGAATGDGNETLAVLPEAVPLEEVVFPFNEAVTRGGPGILVGHVAVPVFDTDAPSRPASLSPKMVTDLVRDTWHYSGVIIADDLAAPAITDTITVDEAAVQALLAGCDAALLLDPNFDTIRLAVEAIDDAVHAGVLSRTTLSESKARLDEWQQWLRKPSPNLIAEIPPLPPVQVAGETPAPEPTAPLEPARTHTVVRGDTLFQVAQTYGVTIQQLQEWNNMRGTTLRIGETIVVSPAVEVSEPEGVSEEPPSEAASDEVAEEEPEAPESAMPPEEVPEEAPEPEESAEPQEPAAAEPQTVTHTVKSGEFLATIADEYGVSYQDIMRWNDLSNTNIRVGQKLTIYTGGEPEAAADAPEPVEEKYTVQRGDFLGKIADQYGVTVQQLMKWNNLSSIDIQVGQVLVIRR